MCANIESEREPRVSICVCVRAVLASQVKVIMTRQLRWFSHNLPVGQRGAVFCGRAFSLVYLI